MAAGGNHLENAKAIGRKPAAGGDNGVQYKILISTIEKMIRMGIKNAMPWKRNGLSQRYIRRLPQRRRRGSYSQVYQPENLITDYRMNGEMSAMESSWGNHEKG